MIASVLPIKVIVMFVLGLMGLGLTFGFPKKMFHAYGAVFGIAMIMYGLFLLKSGAGGFLDNPDLPALLAKMEGWFLVSFLVGALLTPVAQSDMAVSMIAIAMASSGLFGLEEASMIVFGTQAGAGALTYGFSFNFRGRARQVVMGQVFFKALITVLFMALFYLETSFDLPLLLAVVANLSDEVGTQTSAVTLIISFAGALIALLLTRPIHTLIVRLCHGIPPRGVVASAPSGRIRGERGRTAACGEKRWQLRLCDVGTYSSGANWSTLNSTGSGTPLKSSI